MDNLLVDSNMCYPGVHTIIFAIFARHLKSPNLMSNQRYMQRGVSASKEDVHNAIKNIDKGVFPKAFCKIIPDILGGENGTTGGQAREGATPKAGALIHQQPSQSPGPSESAVGAGQGT